jgi:NhaP-type Na+/H+ or K+/H+ antiporter
VPLPPAAAGLGWAEVVFTGWSGLRGSISLIMIADFIAHR